MAYKSVVLEDSVTINRIISVHYFQYMSDFSFPGESHDFWELVCVDRGEKSLQAWWSLGSSAIPLP